MMAADLGQRRRFFGGQVGHDRARDARLASSRDVSLQALTINDRVADHRYDRGLQIGHDAAEHLKNPGELDLVPQGPRVRTLDHRSVGDRIAVGDTQLTKAAAAGDQAAEQIGGELQIGIASRNEGHQGLSPGGAKIVEERIDCGHEQRMRYEG